MSIKKVLMFDLKGFAEKSSPRGGLQEVPYTYTLMSSLCLSIQLIVVNSLEKAYFSTCIPTKFPVSIRNFSKLLFTQNKKLIDR